MRPHLPSVALDRSFAVRVALPLLLGALYVVHCRAVYFVADDGYIGLRYVQSLLRGDGLVYNAGERVEGYTNFLLLALVAPMSALLPAVDMLRHAQLVSVGAGVLAILLVCRFCHDRLGDPPWLSLFAGGALAVHSSFVAWSTAGLETVLFAALGFAAAYAYVEQIPQGRGFVGVPLLFSLLCMTRPDGILLFGLTSIHLLVWQWRHDRDRMRSRLLLWSASFLVCFGSYYVARYAYYGQPVPNTFYVKVGAPGLWRAGFRYVLDYFVTHGVFVFAPAVYALLVRPRALYRDYFALLATGYLAYIVYVGGDGLGFFRFVAHVAPLLYVLATDGLVAVYRRFAPRAPSRLAPALALTFVAAALVFTTRQTSGALLFPASHRWLESHSELRFPALDGEHDYVWFDNYFVDRQREAARWLDQHLPQNSLVASTPAGAIAYFMRHRVLDMLGLNDAHIARTAAGHVGFFRQGHMKGDGRYVLSRRPEAILLGNVAVLPFPLDEARMSRKLVRKSEHEIWAEPSFHRDYELVSVRLHEDGPFAHFTFYKRRDVRLR
jgi:arabinofuranosyltransferase